MSLAGAAWPRLTFAQAAKKKAEPGTILVNDVHSQLNSARVWRVVQPDTLEGVRNALRLAQKEERQICIAGTRHAMGGQQFLQDGLLIDTRRMNKVLGFDPEKGHVEVEAGIQWPQLYQYLVSTQKGRERQWTFAQKQTGADKLTLGGCLSANVHGRGLKMPPFVGDVESFRLVNPKGDVVNCSRSDNPELFRLAIGGYGLFGLITSVTLRLVERRKLERIVEVRSIDGLAKAFAERIGDGFLYGDFQYAIDETSEDFLNRGVFSCYRPVDPATPTPPAQKELHERDWVELLTLAHHAKGEAFRRYAGHYLSTNGQLYWSDEAQMSVYPEGYHRALDKRVGARVRASEAITEIYCERDALERFMAEVRDYARRDKVEIIYGTVRLIEQDRESFLAWARRSYACVIFNVHVEHTTSGLIKAGDVFRRLIDIGLKYGGSYYPTYNRYGLRRQVAACFPQLQEFMKLKLKYDPQKLFQSEWYRHYERMFEAR
ncbi:MAG: L-gulono,4-lactone dehydrogenase [Burkholderiales bacterium]|nr:L-gulono,4-lactone dehydrogenase [Burkholderiales bacterium]